MRMDLCHDDRAMFSPRIHERWTRALTLTALAVAATGCSREEPHAQTDFYERRIAPVLEGSCATSPTRSGCHVAADDRGNALGNLNISSYETLVLRRDLLVNYGPYGLPGLLLKVVPQFDPRDPDSTAGLTLRLTYWDEDTVTVKTEIAHGGGSVIDFTSASFTTLQRWIENGAAKNNAPDEQAKISLQPCSTVLGQDPEFDPNVVPSAPDFQDFVANVNPVLGQNCAAGNCHGSPANSLYLTCGNGPEQERWNYFAAGDYVSAEAGASEMLRRTLSPAQGGTFHEGGTIFETTQDSGYQAILAWAEAKGGPNNVPMDAGFEFFAKRVQPTLVRRGCMMLGCHSAAMFHDYRLRGGSGGHFGLPATRRNYRLSLEQVALESADPNASRLIRKNLPLPPDGGGITHRGGSLFGNGGDPAECDLAAAETAPLENVTPYCMIVAWIAKERQARMQNAMGLSAIVYVRRPATQLPDTPQDYGTFKPGADVVRATASLDAAGAVTMGASTSLSQVCGLTPANTDARRPAVSWDAARIAFAARTGASEPFRIYVVEGSSCAVEPTIDRAPVDENGGAIPNNGELVHNFDPAFAPDGRIVFASTRGNVMNTGAFSYQGTQRTPADPSRLNANLYVVENGGIRQLTFLLNQEIAPSFMSDGRLIFTAEKRAPSFYQLAGRRINLDGGDYHPLFGQRNTIGYTQFTDAVELSDKNLAAIVSEKGAAHEAGRLIIVNRSIGVDQLSDVPEDYLQDPGAIDWPNPLFYQRSIRIVDPAATGKLSGTQGAYRNPSPLPNGRLLVSYAANVQNLGNFSGNFDLAVVDPITLSRTALTTDAADELWPVAVYARTDHGVFRSRLDEANGATHVDPGRRTAEITYLDTALSSSLLFQNTRTGRKLPDGAVDVIMWENVPPDVGVRDFAGGAPFVTSDNYGELFVRRRRLGPIGVQGDNSARVEIPGGLPVVLETRAQLQGEASPAAHHQREEIQFYPGEIARQGFRRDFFNGLCAGCHGSVSGFESEISPRVDILTAASGVTARGLPATDLVNIGRGADEGPIFP
jgi:hypothetical protein